MIRSIQRLRQFGVFRNFRNTQALKDFSSKNIIYGWNYSGKTTLSRLFASVGQGVPYKDCQGATFELKLYDGRSLTEANLTPAPLKLAVFNSDFIAESLSWSGGDFQPILLLGDAVEAEKAIEHLSDRRQICRSRWQYTKAEIAKVDALFAEARARTARDIKQILQIVETFTATHLGSELSRLPDDSRSVLLSDEAYRSDMVLALTKDQDRPTPVAPISVPNLALSGLVQDISTRLFYLPAISATLEHLRSNPTVAQWVEHGMTLHEGKGHCEFCRGSLTEERLQELKGHFSQDLADHRKALSSSLSLIQARRISIEWLDPLTFTASFQQEARLTKEKLEKLCMLFNADLSSLETAVKAKQSDPFTAGSIPNLQPSVAPMLAGLFADASNLIRRQNEELAKFGESKAAAIRRLKAHFAAKFALDPALATEQTRKDRHARFQRRLNAVGKKLSGQIAELQAKVSRAQKGRERLNERIVSLLGSDVLQIEVVTVDGQDRFTLRRSGQPAKNLSDGERAAIAFAFFLTKLGEFGALADVIVYIDDPISSLDSNNVFRVYAAIQSSLFKKETNASGDEAVVVACKQLFISTHNFEFFEMLKRLPGKGSRYFFIKRIGAQESTIVDLPKALGRHRSEYHYLFSIIWQFHLSVDKTDVEQLLVLPNALRRFLELYTYMRLPWPDSSVDTRLAALVTPERAIRITKLLHHFSHLESLDRLATHTNVIADIEGVVAEVIELLQADALHMEALLKEANATPSPL